MRLLPSAMLLAGAAAVSHAGVAIACHNNVIQRAKGTITDAMRSALQNLHLGDIQIQENSLRNIHFEGVDIQNDLTDFRIEDDLLKFNIADFGTRLIGHSWKKVLFGEENCDFEYGINRGGIENFNVQIHVGEIYADNGRVLPGLDVWSGHLDVVHQKWHLSWNSGDLGANIAMWFFKNFQGPIIEGIRNYINDNMSGIMNDAIHDSIRNEQGKASAGMLQSLADILPENNIQIPDGIFIDYAMAQPHAHVSGQQIVGYFEGSLMGLPEDMQITDERYLGVGDLTLDESGTIPFQYQMSAKVLNQMFEVVLGKYQIDIDVPYTFFEDNNFPIKWTSDNLEAAVPGLCEGVGYDKKLSSKFRNRGAPKFIFKEGEITIVFDMEVDVYDEAFENKYLTFNFNEVSIDFFAHVRNQTLTTDWNSIKMKSTEVVSDVIDQTDKDVSGRTCTDFFNTALYFVLPWVNEEQPINVSSFDVPEEIPDLARIRDLQIEPRKDYIHLQMDPEILVKIG